MDLDYNNIFKQEISANDFDRLRNEIYRICGINLADTKKILLEGRIRKRVRHLGFESFGEYVDYLFSQNGFEEELTPLIDVITTNKTDFFREPAHFEYLEQTALPILLDIPKESLKYKNINIWSAGCSSGEEPYTLAIVMSEFIERYPECKFTIYASDISTNMLKTASLGIYEEEKVEVISEALKKKYLLRSKNPEKKAIRIAPEIRALVRFFKINLMDEEYKLGETMDAIFCRNVLIYFDKRTQEKVIGKLARKLNKGGYLFLGHSETIMGMTLPLERAASTVYRKI
jgi:chemotaxis protein methyltransferase CheR